MNPVEASASSAEKILLAATDLFAANHFNGVSIKEIAKKIRGQQRFDLLLFRRQKKSLSGSSQRTVKFIFKSDRPSQQ